MTDDFTSEVTDPIKTQHPNSSEELSYHEYLELDAQYRTSDERPFVDMAFTRRLLGWLGYEESDWEYNDTQGDSASRPDFLVRPAHSIAFVIEDKNTTQEFTKSHIEQLRTYTSGTEGYSIWTNAKTIIILRFLPGGDYEVLARIPIHSGQMSMHGSKDSSLTLFHTLLNRERFTSMPGILDKICVSEEEWEQQARPLNSDDSQQQFIKETRSLLDKLTLSAQVQIEQAESDVESARDDMEETQEKLGAKVEALLEEIGALPDDTLQNVKGELELLVSDPLNVDEESIRSAKPSEIVGTDHLEREWEKGISEILDALVDFREREAQRISSRRIHNSFELWKERYRIIEGKDVNEEERVSAYAQQVAYTFFVRLLLARILEDKGAIKRLISDGGLKTWREVADPSQQWSHEDEVTLHGQSLLSVLFQTVSRFYQHFFDQPVFDWYTPDDYLLAITLERLTTFSFKEIDRDILGNTYEAYVERAFRNEKGHFLTREEIVSYILDEAEYEGRERVIGRSVLDPASGSGSFLVQAVRRLREALDEAIMGDSGDSEDRARLARRFIESVQDNFVGFEINPFSCYLTELNLFLQVLDDLLHLWREEDSNISIEEFQIYNTN